MRHILFLASIGIAPMALNSAILTVTTPSDSGPGTLRNAVLNASNGDEIHFESSLDGATLVLSQGAVKIDALDITIYASDLPKGITLSGNHLSRILTISSGSEVTLRNLTIRNGREESQSGGGLYVQGGSLVMTDCIISDCYSGTNGGGAYFGNEVVLTVDRCSFLGNHGNDFGGGVFLIGTTSVEIRNTVISGNRSPNGGGVLNLNLVDNPVFVNCTVQGNSGAGIMNQVSTAPVLRNSILWGNRIPGSAASIASQQLKNQSGTSPDVDYCLVEGATLAASFNDGDAVTWGQSNLPGIAANAPGFIAPPPTTKAPVSTGDLRVFIDSPVMDRGLDSANPSPLDRARRIRIQEDAIDLGAFESGYVTFSLLYPALQPGDDANQNGRSNFEDYTCGLDPTQAYAAGPNLQILHQDDTFSLSASGRINAAEGAWIWQASHSLESSSWERMMAGVDYQSESSLELAPGVAKTTLELSGTAPKRFFRQIFE